MYANTTLVDWNLSDYGSVLDVYLSYGMGMAKLCGKLNKGGSDIAFAHDSMIISLSCRSNTARHGTAQHGMAQHSIARHVQHAQHARHSMAQHSMAQHGTT